MMDFLRSLSRKHAELKHKIHSTRIPLSRNGKILMGIVYFSTPVAMGWALLQYTNATSDEAPQVRASILPLPVVTLTRQKLKILQEKVQRASHQ